MNFAGNFRHIGNIDISAIKDEVEKLTDDDWNEQSWRQKRYEVHKDTKFIGLVYDPDFRHANSTRHPALEKFKKSTGPILGFVANYYESNVEILSRLPRPMPGYFVRSSIVKLVAGGSISEHRDLNFSLTHSHRVHVPITTNEQVMFSVGSEKIHMQAGEVYEINNRRQHSVENLGDDGRVHLILDWVFPEEPCCCSFKTHPGQPCSPSACLDTVRLKIPCYCHPENVWDWQ